MGLGSVADISLAKARERHAEARAAVLKGIDPIEERKGEKIEQRAAQVAAEARATTFETLADEFITAKAPEWRNAKHADQWRNTLEKHAYPIIGRKAINEIDTADLLAVLQPIWTTKTETASRVRNRIELILDAAKVKGMREGENPARWRGHLDKLLPKKTKVAPVKHLRALPFEEMPAFIEKLREQPGVAPLAIEFLILTAARTMKALGAKWSEIDEQAAVWTIPPERMKTYKEHRVPLSDAALKVLARAKQFRCDNNDLIFPSPRDSVVMCDMSLTGVLRRMKYDAKATTHGFRSTFRDWAWETTYHHPDLLELCLAHTIRNQVEAAYRRGDQLEKRRPIMAEWAAYCEPKKPDNVLKLPRAA